MVGDPNVRSSLPEVIAPDRRDWSRKREIEGQAQIRNVEFTSKARGDTKYMWKDVRVLVRIQMRGPDTGSEDFFDLSP
jgi:hypothetical protein